MACWAPGLGLGMKGVEIGENVVVGSVGMMSLSTGRWRGESFPWVGLDAPAAEGGDRGAPVVGDMVVPVVGALCALLVWFGFGVKGLSFCCMSFLLYEFPAV